MQKNDKDVAENNVETSEIGKPPTWDDVFELMARSKKAVQEETLVSEIIKNLGDKDKKNSKIVYAVCFMGIVAAVGLVLVNLRLANINERNTQRWIDYISQYDFVSQDGEGVNYYNSDIGGDVNNGTESTQEEGQE